MYARLATRAVARRGFHTSRAQLKSPYHYPEGPLTTLPFNARSKWFPLCFWTFATVGFSTPFVISSESKKARANTALSLALRRALMLGRAMC